jgi:hypothetical protein
MHAEWYSIAVRKEGKMLTSESSSNSGVPYSTVRGIDIGQGINVGPGIFDKNIKRRAWKNLAKVINIRYH